MATDPRPGHSGQPKTKLGFDIAKPIKIGEVQKQGGSGIVQKFQTRFLVLYPNFLVYYKERLDWESDKTYQAFRSRKGAVKLKGGSCNAALASGVPAECTFGFILHAPEPTNKRQSFLLNATSDEERTAWITALNNANPSYKKPDEKK